MASSFFGCLAILSLSITGMAMAQHVASPALAVVLPSQPNTPAAATSAPAAKTLFRADSIFINPQVLPQFMGGNEAFTAYLQKNLRYPAEALRQHASGKVLVSFVLSATGLVTYATVLRGPHKLLNEEALRLVWHMPAWQPARQHGQPVRVSCTIPIVFTE